MYLYFDCFAGLDVFMALGAVLNLTNKKTDAESVCKAICSDAELSLSQVKRSSMEAYRAEIKTSLDKKYKTDEILELIEQSHLDQNVKEKLRIYVKIIADARSVNPNDAVFDMSKEMPILCAAAAIFDAVEKMKVKNVLCSRILCSKSFTLTENGFEKVTNAETLYISKKHSLPVFETECQRELLCESGAALLGALGAKKAEYTPGNASKIGYGAGDEDILQIINILRLVLGNDDEEDLLQFEMQLELSELQTASQTL
ncbi:MAG: DUF111 family protein [Clostridia bacterium]|nr:DUF111 family protein [Clostridia bacterium]